MKKPTTFACSMFVLLSFSAYADNDQGNTIITNTVLNALDIPGLEIFQSIAITHPCGTDENHPEWTSFENPAVSQGVILNGITISIKYSEFLSEELAFQGIEFPRKRMTIAFLSDAWEGAAQQKFGEITWHTEDEAILFIMSKTTVFLINCIMGADLETRRAVCEQLALKIVEKIENGCHVIVSNENPPPITAPAP